MASPSRVAQRACRVSRPRPGGARASRTWGREPGPPAAQRPAVAGGVPAADLPGGVKAAMLALRAALPRRPRDGCGLLEPVPLLAGDDRTIVLHLAVYLLGLLDRAVSGVRGLRRRRGGPGALSLLEVGTAATGH